MTGWGIVGAMYGGVGLAIVLIVIYRLIIAAIVSAFKGRVVRTIAYSLGPMLFGGGCLLFGVSQYGRPLMWMLGVVPLVAGAVPFAVAVGRAFSPAPEPSQREDS